MAMLLAAMRSIVCSKSHVGSGIDYRFVFQRAEENPITPSGGDVLVNEEGVLEGAYFVCLQLIVSLCDITLFMFACVHAFLLGIGVSACFGLHVHAMGLRGVFYGRKGNMMANSDRLLSMIFCFYIPLFPRAAIHHLPSLKP